MPRGGARGALVLAPALLLLSSCSTLFEEHEPVTPTRFQPPPASAPPDPGVSPPEVRIHDAADGTVPPDSRPQLQLASWSAAMSEDLNVPRAALAAYGYAARVLQRDEPQCQLSWPVLAGIGAVESSHGRYQGSRLDEAGQADPPIIGVPLDGSVGVRAIPDTDGGVWDGDQEWDRAIGPLQFIPDTWREWGVDAAASGVADPQNINDAALAAGRYLCFAGGDLRDPDDFWSALLSYNASTSYAHDVLNWADYYGRTSRTLPADRR